MDQVSDEEVEVRGEEEEEEEDSDKEDQDLDKMFGAWLGELDKLTQSLDDGRPEPPPQQKAPLRQETNMANFSYRFSIYNINEALNQGDNVDLDALMADLCSIEQELSTINNKPNSSSSSSSLARLGLTDTKVRGRVRVGLGLVSLIRTAPDQQQLQFILASLSMDEAARQTSSHSLTSQRQHRRTGSVGTVSEHEEEQAAKLKAENIRVALEKIKEAQVKKLVIRVHLSDESSKTMMVDERQTVRQVLDSLLEKSHCGYSADWSLVETINELQMDKVRQRKWNKLTKIDKKNTTVFVFQECFGGSSVSVPEMEGVLWLKEDGKKSWKKRYFLLRASGIYYVPKGKAKASRDLVCFLQLDHVNVYLGQDYKSKYKAPTDYCMVLKHPQIQKKSQYIKYLCCDDVRTLQQWINSIRIAKYGKQLYTNFQEAMRRSEAAYDWSSLSSSSIKSGSSSSSLPESQSNHSSQSDSGVSEMTSSGHTRSQSVVSSIFSDAWRRGTQGEFGPSSPSALPPPPPLEDQEPSYLPPPPPESLEANGLPPPPPPEPSSSCPPLSNTGLQQFLSQKFPNMVYDFSQGPDEDSPPPPPPPPGAELSPPASLQVLRPLSPNAPPPPPPTLPKQHSLSSKNLTISPSSSSSSVSIAAATSSLVKQIVNQFPGNSAPSSLPTSNSTEGSKFSAPQSPPAVKAKPKWQPGGVVAPQSPEFPPPPPDSSLGDFPPPPSSKTGSPVKKSPSTSSTGSTKRGPPPTPQRASSIREAQEERPKKVESLVSKFGQAPQTGTSSSSSSATGSPSKDSSLPAPLPKPGKLNLANLPLALDFELFPPPPHPSEFHHPPKVAVVNPQPQMPPPHRRTSNTGPYDTSMPLSPPPLSQTPKSVSRHGSLTSSHLITSSKMEPVGTMDDMALLPPPPPELLQQQQGSAKHANISGYATLRRGPPPAPPKRDQSTKLTSDW
uniref:Ras association (RalGDS/AF-6) and pleckstrin homology domains 1 n=1 Tax=Acanthochromis polyacanthus TaxID=80966 RepID=A0A3Q1FJG8_9TELE